MSVEIVKHFFADNNIDKEILEFPVSSATVELAAQAAGVEPARIAKTLSFYTKEKDGAILIVTAGDRKIDNSKLNSYTIDEKDSIFIATQQDGRPQAIGGLLIIMQYYSDKTKKVYKTVDELNDAEKKYDDNQLAIAKRNDERKARAKEVEDAYKVMEDAVNIFSGFCS